MRFQHGSSLIKLQMGSKSGKETDAAVISVHACIPSSLHTPITAGGLNNEGSSGHHGAYGRIAFDLTASQDAVSYPAAVQ